MLFMLFMFFFILFILSMLFIYRIFMQKNNWEIWHDTTWTEFETHSAMFGLLRKHFKGQYLIRGDYCFITADGTRMHPDISIFQIVEKGKPAVLRLTVEVKKEGNEENTYLQKKKYESLGVPCIVVTGKQGLFNVLEKVKEHL